VATSSDALRYSVFKCAMMPSCPPKKNPARSIELIDKNFLFTAEIYEEVLCVKRILAQNIRSGADHCGKVSTTT
jgi:hypothetical protein